MTKRKKVLAEDRYASCDSPIVKECGCCNHSKEDTPLGRTMFAGPSDGECYPSK